MISNKNNSLQSKQISGYRRVTKFYLTIFFTLLIAACNKPESSNSTLESKANNSTNPTTTSVDTATTTPSNVANGNPVPENSERFTYSDTNKTLASLPANNKVVINHDMGAKDVKQGGARIDLVIPQLVLPECANIIVTELTKLPDVESVSTSGYSVAVVVSNNATNQMMLEEAISKAGFNTKNFRHNVEAYNKLPKECKDGADTQDDAKKKEKKSDEKDSQEKIDKEKTDKEKTDSLTKK